MTMTVKKVALSEPVEPLEQKPIVDPTLNFIDQVDVHCSVRLGTLTMTVAELRQLKQGQVLALAQKTNEPVEILVNHQVIAHGELMCCGEHFAIQITGICFR